MRKGFRFLTASLLAAAGHLAAESAQAQVAYATTAANQLVRFDASAPGTILGSVAITGAPDTIVGIDFRPATGQLLGAGSGGRLYVINTWTGVATQIGTGATFSPVGTSFGFDVNPTVDRIRLTSDADQNLRLNPDTGAIAGNDTALAYAAADPNAGQNPSIAGTAYTNSFGGSTTTTLYGIDYGLDVLVVQNPPNNGTLNTVGPLGVDASAVTGFDIRFVSGVNTAYAAMQVGGASRFYTFNLATGAATLVGSFPAGMTITGLAMAPTPFNGSPDLNGDGRSDILYRNITTGQVFRMLMNGFAVTNAQMVHTEPNLAWKVVADGDFTGDGISDLLWRNSSTGQVYLMPFTSSGEWHTGSVIYTEPDPAWEIVQAPDLDGNGYADLLWVNSSTGQVYAMLMGFTGIIAQGTVHTEPNPDWVIVGVMGNAGRGRQNQLLWRHAVTGQVYLMTVGVSVAGPAATFTTSGSVIYTEPDTAWQIIGTPDLDGDGRSDILWRNASTGQVYGMIMNFGAINTQGMIYTEPNLAWKIVNFGDYNGDGKADLLWRNENTGQLFMMRMNGLSIAAQQVVYDEPDTAWKVMGPYEYVQ